MRIWNYLSSDPVGFLISVAAIIFVFGVVIFVHEFGHFFVAKRSGVKVEQFSFGFGAEIFGFTWGETRYTVNWIPLGGFVKMAGDTPEGSGPTFEGGAASSSSPTEKHREFFAKPWWHRFLIALAGPVMNYCLAIVIFTSMLLIWGESAEINKARVGAMLPDRPAVKAGLKTGDEILTVQDQPVDTFENLAKAIHARPEQPTNLLVRRDGETFTLQITPHKDPASGNGIIGIKPFVEHHEVGFKAASMNSIRMCWLLSKFQIVYLYDVIKNRKKPELAGPIGISNIIVEVAKTGWESYLGLIATISVAIGLFNLFPIPMLDGGHMLYYVIEGARGRPVSERVMGQANRIGFILLMVLIVFVTFSDIQRLVKPRAPAEIIEAAPTPTPVP